MRVLSYSYRNGNFTASSKNENMRDDEAQLVLGFGAKNILSADFYGVMQQRFPHAEIALGSTAGEIFDTEVLDDTVSAVALTFEATALQTSQVNISGYEDSYAAGAALSGRFKQEKLRYLFVLSDGSQVNGSELVRGIESVIGHKVPVTGGLAGDGAAFQSTLVGLNSAPDHGNIIAIGFYGDAIEIAHGSMGGWEMFGLERTVTRSKANQLLEIDGKNALELYKIYLGKYADELPGSALLFPISIILSDNSEPVVRTILSINEEDQTMIFAGDVPEGAKIRFMKANFDRLIDAATGAANNTLGMIHHRAPKLALLISCVGRKLILDTRVDEEVEAVDEALGGKSILSGFYSYGEISPLNPAAKCELHNQTMTITTFDEIAG